MRTIAVIGPNGQLGSDLVKVFSHAGWRVIAVGHNALAVEEPASAREFFDAESVDAVVNTAAFHQVAACEQAIARAWAVNAAGARHVAEAAREIGAVSVFISTDYVFDGTIDGDSSYAEDAFVCPINSYGAAKAAGEQATLAASERNAVVRISSAFGAAGSSGKGGNFVETVIRKARSGESLAVVDDILMSPSYTLDVATKVVSLLDRGATGIFHGNNEGRVSWHGFATEICNQIGVDVSIEKATSDFNVIPRRPRNSSLSTDRLAAVAVQQRPWREALTNYLREKGHIS